MSEIFEGKNELLKLREMRDTLEELKNSIVKQQEKCLQVWKGSVCTFDGMIFKKSKWVAYRYENEFLEKVKVMRKDEQLSGRVEKITKLNITSKYQSPS